MKMQQMASVTGAPVRWACKPSTSPHCVPQPHGARIIRQRADALRQRTHIDVQLGWGRRRFMLAAEGNSSGSTSTTQPEQDAKIKTTLADLDAILGIQEEPAEDKSKVCMRHVPAPAVPSLASYCAHSSLDYLVPSALCATTGLFSED